MNKCSLFQKERDVERNEENCAPKSIGECGWRELRRENLKSLEKCQPISKEKVI
jgi:hypothetical protein